MSRKMKDSGVEWIGEIPENWSVCKTLNCLVMPITDGPHTTPELFDEGIPFISAEAVSCGNGSIDFSHMRGYISREFYDECCKKYIPEIDDIYMIKSGATTGKVSIVDTDKIFTIWSPLAVFRCNKQRVLPKFMFYFLQSYPYQKQVELGWSYGTQQNIGMRALEKLKVFLPPIEEQNKISDKIDKKCSQIDTLISNQQKQIEKLKQYKQSIITETVTKGLNPDAEMKDSGVEWIGEIPSEWEMAKIKNVADQNDEKYTSGSYDYIALENVESLTSKFIQTESVYSLEGNKMADEGDVIFGKLRPYLRKVMKIKKNVCVSNEFIVYKPKSVTGDFLKYYLLSDGFISAVNASTYGTKMPRANSSFVDNCEIIFPKMNIQKEISNYLDEKCNKIDSLISIKEQKIEKLNQYKKSVIYEYVTGKKEA